MSFNKKLTVKASGDFEIVMERSFAAPRDIVFEAFTTPIYVQQWMLGPPGWTMPVCKIDLRVGGNYHYVWKNQDGMEMAISGMYKEIVAPAHLVFTEVFAAPWYKGESVTRAQFEEKNEITVVTSTLRYESREVRDGVLKTPMESGVAVSYNNLDNLLSTIR